MDSSSLDDFNSSSDNESEDEDDASAESNSTIIAKDFDFIDSVLNLPKQEYFKYAFNKLSRKKFKEGYRSGLKFLKEIKNEASTKNIASLWKPKPKQYIIVNMREVRKAQLEREWYSAKHDKKFKAPSEYTAEARKKNEEERKIEIEKALNILRKQSKRKVCELNKYKPTISLPPAACRSSWKDAPLAVKCCCTKNPGSCICKGSTLYPGKSIPFAKYIRPPKNICLYKILELCRIINTKKAGTFVPNYQTAARVENQLYRTPEALAMIKERGPEICFSNCYQFFKTEKKANAQKLSYLAKLEKLKQDMLLKEMPEEKEEEVLEVEEEETYEEEEGQGEEEDEELEELKDDEITEVTRDEYYMTEGTMTDNDEIGDLVEGRYSHLLFGRCEYTHMKDISGTCLQISNYNDEVQAPKSVFNFESIFHLKALKQSISRKIDQKIQKFKKDFVTSVFDVYEKYVDRETQFDCNDIPDSGAVCESLVNAIRRHREMIKNMNRKRIPLVPVISDETTIDKDIKSIPDNVQEPNIKLVDQELLSEAKDDVETTDNIDKELKPKNEDIKFSDKLNESNQEQLINTDTVSLKPDQNESNKNNFVEKEVTQEINHTETPSKETEAEKMPITPRYPCDACKQQSNDTLSNTDKTKDAFESNINYPDSNKKEITESLEEATKSKEHSFNNIESCSPCIKKEDSSPNKDQTNIANATDNEHNENSNSPVTTTCSPCTIEIKNNKPILDNEDVSESTKILEKSKMSKENLVNKMLIQNCQEFKEAEIIERHLKQPISKTNEDQTKDKLNKRQSCTQNIINESAIAKLSVTSKYSGIKPVKNIRLRNDIPSTSKQITQPEEMKSNAYADFEKEFTTYKTGSSSETLNICIRDVYKNISDTKPYMHNNAVQFNHSKEISTLSNKNSVKSEIINNVKTAAQNTAVDSCNIKPISENLSNFSINKNARCIDNVKQSKAKIRYSTFSGILLKASRADSQITKNRLSFREIADLKSKLCCNDDNKVESDKYDCDEKPTIIEKIMIENIEEQEMDEEVIKNVVRLETSDNSANAEVLKNPEDIE